MTKQKKALPEVALPTQVLRCNPANLLEFLPSFRPKAHRLLCIASALRIFLLSQQSVKAIGIVVKRPGCGATDQAHFGSVISRCMNLKMHAQNMEAVTVLTSTDIGKNNTCETYHTVIINKLLLIMKIQKCRILHTISEVHGLLGDLQVKNP